MVKTMKSWLCSAGHDVVLQRKPFAFELSNVITNAWFSMKN